jgi:5-methylthioadenosine/S-adenosylhomocysteine deaminase
MTEEPRDTLTADSVLRMATSDGARALGWDQLTGTLAAGKRADIIAVRLPTSTAGPADAAGLATLLVAGAAADDVRMTMVDGKVVFDAEERAAIPEEVTARYGVARKKLGLQ